MGDLWRVFSPISVKEMSRIEESCDALVDAYLEQHPDSGDTFGELSAGRAPREKEIREGYAARGLSLGDEVAEVLGDCKSSMAIERPGSLDGDPLQVSVLRYVLERAGDALVLLDEYPLQRAKDVLADLATKRAAAGFGQPRAPRPAAGGPAAPRSAAGGPAAPRSAAGGPAAPRSAADGPAAPRSAADGPAAPRSAADGPAAPRSAADGPAAPRSAADGPEAGAAAVPAGPAAPVNGQIKVDRSAESVRHILETFEIAEHNLDLQIDLRRVLGASRELVKRYVTLLVSQGAVSDAAAAKALRVPEPEIAGAREEVESITRAMRPADGAALAPPGGSGPEEPAED